MVAEKTHVAAPASTNSQGLTAKPVREELSDFCACTGPVRTGFDAVDVECGGQTAEKKSTYTYTQARTEKVVQGTLPSYAIRYEGAFFFGKPGKKG